MIKFIKIILFSILIIAYTNTGLSAIKDELILGLPIAYGSTKIEEHRFKSNRTLKEVKKFYNKLFRYNSNYYWKSIINLPGIKAVHLASNNEKDKWKGINIYSINGETGFFILKR